MPSTGLVPVSVTVYGPVPLPLTSDTAQPLAPPPTLKSPTAKPVTASENVNDHTRLVPLTWALGPVNDATVGAVRSTVNVAAAVTTAGPAFMAASATAFCASDNTTVPLDGLEAVTETVYGPAPEPLGVPTLQPDDVPVIANLPAVSPVTNSLKATVYAMLALFTVVEAGVNVTVGSVRSTVTLFAVASAF